MGQYTVEQIIFVDESSVNESSGHRHWGWSKIGEQVTVISTLQGPPRWTILPALSVDGYVCSRVVPEGFNAAQFLEFVEQDLLPIMQPYPAPQSVVIMDNCR